MRLLITFFALAFLSVPLQANNNDFCDMTNTSFRTGESLTYKVFYTVAGAYLGVGEAVLTYNLERFNEKDVYHVVAEGKTYGFYDNIFKVRDRYESYLDTATLQSYKFIRNVYEGGYKIYENVTFLKSTGTAIMKEGVYKVSPCIQDVMSAMSRVRNIDFNHLKPNEKVPFDMFLDKQVYHLYIRYLGKEAIRTKYARFRAIKLKVTVVQSNIFDGGEKMTVWISDDPNHIALRAESPIIVGKVKIDMINYKNLRYPLSSLVDM